MGAMLIASSAITPSAIRISTTSGRLRLTIAADQPYISQGKDDIDEEDADSERYRGVVIVLAEGSGVDVERQDIRRAGRTAGSHDQRAFDVVQVAHGQDHERD